MEIAAWRGDPTDRMFCDRTDGEEMEMQKGKETSSGGNFFGRSALLRRTPPGGSTPVVETRAPAGVQSQKGLKSRLNQLMEKINALKTFVDSKPNIHAEAKRLVVVVKAAASEAIDEARALNWGMARDATQQATPLEVATRHTQTEAHQTETPLRTKTPALVATTGKTKRRRTPAGDKKERPPKQLRLEGAGNEDTPKTSRKGAAPKRKADGGKGTARSKVMTKRPRADAIVVEAAGTATYANIQRAVRTDATLKGLEERFVGVKRNQKGQMMLELAKEEGAKKDELREAVRKALGDRATVTVRTQEVNIVCKDMDEVTTKDEVLEALRTQLGTESLSLSAIRSLRPAYGGTQTAVISLSLELAKKVLKTGKVRIGWTICRVREAMKPKQCFRCLDYGHLAKDCKGEDRSKLCRRCGEGGHFAKDCKTKDPCCMICSTKDKKAAHVTGSSRCPKFRSSKGDKT